MPHASHACRQHHAQGINTIDLRCERHANRLCIVCILCAASGMSMGSVQVMLQDNEEDGTHNDVSELNYAV